MRGRTRAAFVVSSAGIVAILVVAAVGGIAAAVSGGGYNPNQQDCPWNGSAWSTPTNQEYPGCHNTALNVESGGTTNGQANTTNTRYVEFGSDQEPIDPNSQGTPTIESLGYPGNTGEPHAGCVAVNTDGTGGGPAPAGTAPESAGNAENSPYGCGNNPNGAGLEANYDTYALLCPLAAAAGHPCEDPSYMSTPLVFNPDTGQSQSLSALVTNGTVVYFGMDDNFDNGEHDGFDGLDHTDSAINGPSDGGAMILSLQPTWLMSSPQPSPTHPEGLANYSEGECADGICGALTTQQQTEYYGCYDPSNPNDGAWSASGTDGANSPQNGTNDQCSATTPQSTDVYQNSSPSSTQESPNCNGGGPDGGPNGTEDPCLTNYNGTANPGGADAYRQNTPQQTNAEPGVQTYQDPDPQRSPAAPFATPGLYVGTCGVYVNDNGGYGDPGLIGFLTNGMVPEPPAGYIGQSTDPSC